MMWAYHIETVYTTIPYGAHAELRRIMTPMNCKVRYFSVGRLDNRTVLLTMMKSDVVSLYSHPYRSPYQFSTLGCKDCARCRTDSSTGRWNSRWSPRFILQSELVPCLSGRSICASACCVVSMTPTLAMDGLGTVGVFCDHFWGQGPPSDRMGFSACWCS